MIVLFTVADSGDVNLELHQEVNDGSMIELHFSSAAESSEDMLEQPKATEDIFELQDVPEDVKDMWTPQKAAKELLELPEAAKNMLEPP